MYVDALVDEVHVDIVGVGGNRQGAYPGLGNAAGGNVGGNAVGKFQHRGDIIFAFRMIGSFDGGGLYVDDRRPDQRLDDFDVVDHQVHGHVDVGNAAGSGGHSLRRQRTDLGGVGKDFAHLFNRRVKSLDMADQKHDIILFGGVDQAPASFFGSGQRLFHHAVNAFVQKEFADVRMGDGSGDDTDGVNLFGNFLHAGKYFYAECFSVSRCHMDMSFSNDNALRTLNFATWANKLASA